MSDGPRLLWIHQNFVSAKQSGVSRALYFLAALAHHGWAVDLVCSRAGYLDDSAGQDLSAPVIEREGALSIHRLGVPKNVSSLRSRARSYFDFIRRASAYAATLPPPDVIFSSTPPLPVTLPALQIAGRRRLPVVLELRDLWPAFLVDGGTIKPGPATLFLGWNEALAMLQADHIVVTSPAYATYVEQLGIPASRLSMNFTGGDPHYLGLDRAAGAEWRAAHGYDDSQTLALFAGSFNEYNNLEILIEAIQRLRDEHPELRLLLAGAGRQLPLVEEAVRRYPNVHYLGMLPRDELPALLFAADFGIVSYSPWLTIQAAVPGKLFEYLAAGLPVLNNALGQPAYIVEASQGGLAVAEQTVERVAEAMRQLARLSRQKRQAMGARGRDWVLSHANSFAMGEQLFETVARIHREHPHGTGRGPVLLNALRATGWVLGRRSAAPLARLRGPDRHALIRAAFERWLASPIQQTEPPGFTLPMPAPLSGRDCA